jgi:hypothetical protein
MDVLPVGEPQLVDAARVRAGAVEKSDRAGVLRHRDVEQFEAGGLQPMMCGLVGDGHDVADRFQRVRAHMRSRGGFLRSPRAYVRSCTNRYDAWIMVCSWPRSDYQVGGRQFVATTSGAATRFWQAPPASASVVVFSLTKLEN